MLIAMDLFMLLFVGGGRVSAFEWCVLFLVAQCVLFGGICDKILAI